MLNLYKTASLSLAAAVQTISTAKLERIDFSALNNRAEFIFDKSKDANFDSIVTRFWTKNLPIDAFSYFESLKYLKSRLYEEKNI